MSQRSFVIDGIIGKGGFGKVYKALLEDDSGFRTAVALKLLDPEDHDDGMMARFRDEAKVLGLIRDPAVVQVFPPAELDNKLAVIMEYVDGQTAKELYRKHKPLPPRIVAEIVREVARALDVLQTLPGPDGRPLGVIHRDLKPENIQITPQGSVKVLDFGIAKAQFAGREAKTVNIMGTPRYMAPERLQDGIDIPAGDIYSLGCIVRRLAFGERNNGGGKFSANLLEMNKLSLQALHDLAKRMTERVPANRPSAREVEELLDDLIPELPGSSLRRWTEAHVEEREVGQCPLSGRVFRDQARFSTAPASTPALSAGLLPSSFGGDEDIADEPTVLRASVPEAPGTWEGQVRDAPPTALRRKRAQVDRKPAKRSKKSYALWAVGFVLLLAFIAGIGLVGAGAGYLIAQQPQTTE